MRRLVSIDVDESIFSIRGWQAHGLALGAGLRPTYNGVRGAWVADTKRLPQLVAYLEHRNVAYEVSSSGHVVPQEPRESDDSRVADETPAQPSLFDGSR